mgnify:FL=1
MAVNYQNAAKVGVGVGLISAGLSYLYGMVFKGGGFANVQFAAIDVNVREQVTSGLDTGLASKVLGYMSGVIPTGGTLGALLTVAVAGLIVVLLGYLIRGFGAPDGSSQNMKLASTMFYGSLVGGFVLSYMNGAGIALPQLGTAIAMVIYFSIVALVYNLLREKVKSLPLENVQ